MVASDENMKRSRSIGISVIIDGLTRYGGNNK